MQTVTLCVRHQWTVHQYHIRSCPSPKIGSSAGGGTVHWVTQEGHRFLDNVEDREEGGTPNILGILRAAVPLQLQARLVPPVSRDRRMARDWHEDHAQAGKSCRHSIVCSFSPRLRAARRIECRL